ncbi:MAG TPA: exodeoxyribonuclease I, partial [Gammaproteobacteria bacterium]|nr:exodeoxyribonuclease I [Gammaproteobacteria bacterium]
MSGNSIYWYDFETFGRDPRRTRASQFAGIRTDEDLNIISEPLVFYCKPADDFLPDPMACLITGISPQKALQEGVCESEFIQRIEREFSQPGTCVAGYNSIRFDDELTRQLLYRNFYDPYEREWKNGNSRWDIIDMLRLCAATRSEGIVWPQREDGSTSFRLEQLTAANGIEHADAHDALSDVIATIEMAKLVRQQQPKLYEYVYKLRNKRAVQSEIDM